MAVATLGAVSKCKLFSTPGKANLTGFVHDEGDKAIVSALVKLDTMARYTSSSGSFEFTDIDTGTYTITCTKEGYKPFSYTVTLTQGDNEIDIELVSEVTPPPEKKRDILDTIIRYVEENRPPFPIKTVDDMISKGAEVVIDITPEIPILPAE